MTEKLGFTERQYQILNHVQDNGETLSKEVAKKLDIDIHNASMRLKDYYENGWLSRERGAYGRFKYTITEQGENRIDWLEENRF
ncbi:hypothetical protein AKJ56_02010 [candidate division MSBL1 archaeon SCGC-AAA382N08]|uniref:Uncharacterized protein n=1 Tax=candidate division MSBL1 archaeon SCGC-AAA382N08 TaxID=1698285 RepID=A0A133VNG9_9EURY|nr:hypothetical protein AKJ56_02010 [candidate division MSBL1 archaeon SCGC-AAA382N08]